MAYKNKLSAFENSTLTFDLTQIQVLSFQCKHFFMQVYKAFKYVLKIILKSVGF